MNPKTIAMRTLRTLRVKTLVSNADTFVAEKAVVAINTPPMAAKPEMSGIACKRVRERP